MGEVYGSFGVTFSKKKACSEFQRFLDLTTDEKFGAIEFHPMLYFTANNIQESRMTAQDHLRKLGEKHRLLLRTSHRELARLESGLDKELKELHKRISKWKAQIAVWERKITLLKRSRLRDRGHRIRVLRRWIRDNGILIARAEKRIEFVTAELARIREAQQK